MRLYIDFDGIIRDMDTSIEAAFPNEKYDTYHTDLYSRYRSEILENDYEKTVDWAVYECKAYPSALNTLRDILASGKFSEVHILTAQQPKDIHLVFMSMIEMGILELLELPDILDEIDNYFLDKLPRSFSKDTSVLTNLYLHDYFKNPLVLDHPEVIPHVQITRQKFPKLFRYPLDSIISVPKGSEKAKFLKILPGVLIDDRVNTIIDIHKMDIPDCYGIWSKHRWSADQVRFDKKVKYLKRVTQISNFRDLTARQLYTLMKSLQGINGD